MSASTYVRHSYANAGAPEISGSRTWRGALVFALVLSPFVLPIPIAIRQALSLPLLAGILLQVLGFIGFYPFAAGISDWVSGIEYPEVSE